MLPRNGSNGKPSSETMMLKPIKPIFLTNNSVFDSCGFISSLRQLFGCSIKTRVTVIIEQYSSMIEKSSFWMLIILKMNGFKDLVACPLEHFVFLDQFPRKAITLLFLETLFDFKNFALGSCNVFFVKLIRTSLLLASLLRVLADVSCWFLVRLPF